MITTREIVDRLKDIYDRLAAAASFRWGVVVSTTPPLVRLDADTDPVIVGTIAPLTVGSRVLVLLQNRKNTVIGSAGGDPNLIIIGGVVYARSGVLPQITVSTTTGAGSLYAGYVKPSVPTPPGWGVSYQLLEGPGNVWMGPSGGDSIKGVGFISTTAGPQLVSLAWQLIKL